MWEMAATSLHDVFFDSEERHEQTLHCAVAHSFRWREWLRAPEISRWQEVHRVEWDATGVRNGWPGRIVWETLLEMDRFDCRAGEMDQGAVTVMIWPGRPGFSVSQLCVGWGNTYPFHQENAASALRLRAPEAGSSRHHGHLPSVEVELLALSHCASRCHERSDEGVSAREADGFCGQFSQPLWKD